MIVVPALKVGFQGVPKVGTTAIYLWMFDLCALVDGKRLQNVPRGREYFVRGRGGNLTVDNEEEAIEPYEDYFRIAFYRDPIKRFLSMYRNRVVYHRELSPKSKAAPMLEQNGLSFNPQPNELVARLDEYMASAASIDHHARPQIDFIGPDKSVYTRLVDLKAIEEVLVELRTHWRKNGMDALAASELVPGREQTGGPKLGLEALSEQSFEKLVRFYRADYHAFSELSVDAIRAEYRAAVASQSPAAPVIFWESRTEDGWDGTRVKSNTATTSKPTSAAAQFKPSQSRLAQMKAVQAKVAEAAMAGDAPSATKPPSDGSNTSRQGANRPAKAGLDGEPLLRLTLKKQELAEVALLRADFPRGGISAGETFALGGQCLLAPDCEAADYALRLRLPGHVKDCVWALNSPGLVEKYPDNKNAPRARFKVTGVSLQVGERADLLLRRTEGSDEQLLASLSISAG